MVLLWPARANHRRVMDEKKGYVRQTAFISLRLLLVVARAFDRPGKLGGAPSNEPDGGVSRDVGTVHRVMFIARCAEPGAQIVFATLMILFFLLAYGDFTGASAGSNILPATKIFCGFSAITPPAQVLNELFG